MKKLIVAFVAVGAVLALRPVVKRRMAQKMREHCKQMAAKCKQMMAQPGARGEEVRMHQHGEQMAEPVGDRREAVSA